MAHGAIELAPMQALGYAPAPAPMTRLLAWPTDPATASYAAASLAPAGWFGNLISGIAPVAGRAIGGLFGGSGSAIGSQIGSALGGLAGGILPFHVDPLTAAYASGRLT